MSVLGGGGGGGCDGKGHDGFGGWGDDGSNGNVYLCLRLVVVIYLVAGYVIMH